MHLEPCMEIEIFCMPYKASDRLETGELYVCLGMGRLACLDTPAFSTAIYDEQQRCHCSQT